MQSVVCVHHSVSLYLLQTCDLDFCTCTGHDLSSPGIESQGHMSMSYQVLGLVGGNETIVYDHTFVASTYT